MAFYVDEWGTWYDPEPGREPGFLYQQNTLRDALVAGINFNIFHRHAKRVQMTNIAQMVNVLQAMILTDGPKMALTPTYHVFQMYIPFQGATFLPTEITTPDYSLGQLTVPAVSVSAARDTAGNLQLALANLDPKREAVVRPSAGRECDVGARAASDREGHGRAQHAGRARGDDAGEDQREEGRRRAGAAAAAKSVSVVRLQ